MKLARKFTITFILGMCAVLAISGISTAHREIELFQSDMKKDHQVLGEGLAAAFVQVWENNSPEEAQKFIEKVAGPDKHVRLRWVPLEAFGRSPPLARLSPTDLETLRSGQEVFLQGPVAGDVDHRFSYVPVFVEENFMGALELDESLTEEKSYLRKTVINIFLVTGAIILVSALLAVGLGILLVGRPVRELMRKARRVGGGDLTGPLELRHRDELSALAEEFNAMCDHLAEARRKLDAETSARITALQQLRHADRLITVGKLASGVAHELGTPLNVVWAQAQMIESGEVAEREAAESARVITQQAQRMTRIIRQLLDFARPRSPKKCSTDLHALAQQVLNLLARIAEKNRVELRLADSPGPTAAEVDADQILQVLSNLVLNGVQSMKQGGLLTVTVTRRTVRPPADHGGAEGEFVAIEVRDQGMGIPEEHLSSLFVPFFTTKEVGEGTGLGLSVSLGIVREHGGWISVESQPGAGSCFTVFLP